MNLGTAKTRDHLRILDLDPAQPAVQRIMALGLLPGAAITVAHVAPLGDPITLDTEVGRISLRRSDAAAITVEPA